METIEQHSGPIRPVLRCHYLRVKSAAQEIALDDLEEGDVLLIQTVNSVYSFWVTDAEAKTGLLTGGRLSEERAPVLLIGGNACADDSAGTQGSAIVVGLRAVFLMAAASNSRRLVTSTIKSLTHIKTRKGASSINHGKRP